MRDVIRRDEDLSDNRVFHLHTLDYIATHGRRLVQICSYNRDLPPWLLKAGIQTGPD